MPASMPAISFRHGNSMEALSSNRYTEGWRKIGERMREPRAALSIPPIVIFRRPVLRSAPHLGRFTISAVFRVSCTKFASGPLRSLGRASVCHSSREPQLWFIVL
jgi:hypothetical protein